MSLRCVFVNTGILGHASVGRLLREAAARERSVDAVHVDLSSGLTPAERVVRRALCMGPRPGSAAGALTAARFRHELHAGMLAARRLREMDRRGDAIDAIHFHTQAAAYASLRRMRRTPCIVSIDVTQRLAAAEVRGFAAMDYAPTAARDRAVFHAAAAVTATSRWAADDLLRGQPELEGRVHVMPYPVPLEGFDAAWARERADRPADHRPRLLFVGGDFRRKGGYELLAAWRAGGFGARGELHLVTDWRFARGEAEGPGIVLHRGVRPYTPAWFALWRDADAFVMPTRGEAFGMVFQEAAAAALPVIGTRIAAVPEIVAEGETGLLVPPGDRDALIEAMHILLAKPAVRHRMGDAARRRIARTASMAHYAERLSRLIHEVAGG